MDDYLYGAQVWLGMLGITFGLLAAAGMLRWAWRAGRSRQRRAAVTEVVAP